MSNSTPEDETFENSFYEWLETRGVKLINLNLSDSDAWNAQINLNTLKLALDTYYDKAYQQGRIGEAKTCEEAGRHDYKARVTALLERLEATFPTQHHNSYCGFLQEPRKACRCSHEETNKLIDQWRSIINEELEKLK